MPEDVGKGIAKIVFKKMVEFKKNGITGGIAQSLLEYLDQHNVVQIDESAELPGNPYKPVSMTCEDSIPYGRAQRDMLEANYRPIKRLIKEE